MRCGHSPGRHRGADALAHSHLQVVGFDLPQVAPIFEDYVAALGLEGRLTFAPGSFFDTPLPQADVIVMGHILHDWDLATKKMLIRKAYDALPDGGAYIVYDAIIDDDRRKNAFGLMMSLNMLIETYGGFDYCGADCEGWMREIGFKETRVEHLVGPDSMVIGIRVRAVLPPVGRGLIGWDWRSGPSTAFVVQASAGLAVQALRAARFVAG